MEDLYESLLSPAPTDPERIRKTAELLRQRRNQGVAGALSGDRVLAPIGQGMIKTADDSASEIGQRRQDEARQADVRTYQQHQMDYMDRNLNETIRNNNLDYLSRQRMADAAMMRASGAGDPQFRKMTDSTLKRAEGAAADFMGLQDLSDSFRDEYAVGALPFSRRVGNFLSSTVPQLASKDQEEAQRWWSQAQLLYNLPERYKLFGATLTTNEKKSWEAATFNPDMTADQIRTNMALITSIHNRKVQQIRNNLIRAGYRPEEVEGIFEQVQLPGEMPGSPGPTGGAAPKFEMRSSRSRAGGPSLAEIDAEMQALKQELGFE
jgi:hypothetical protein